MNLNSMLDKVKNIKPCAYCNNTSVKIFPNNYSDEMTAISFCLECDRCENTKLLPWSNTLEDAVSSWNRAQKDIGDVLSQTDKTSSFVYQRGSNNTIERLFSNSCPDLAYSYDNFYATLVLSCNESFLANIGDRLNIKRGEVTCLSTRSWTVARDEAGIWSGHYHDTLIRKTPYYYLTDSFDLSQVVVGAETLRVYKASLDWVKQQPFSYKVKDAETDSILYDKLGFEPSCSSDNIIFKPGSSLIVFSKENDTFRVIEYVPDNRTNNICTG